MRIGLLVPSSNTVMEPDFHRHLGQDCIVSTTRIFLENVTREAEVRMLEEDLPRAIELLRTTSPNVVVFGCTSAGALGQDNEIADRIASGTRARAVTVLHAVQSALQNIAPRRLAVFTPYVEDLTNCIASSLAAAGMPPVKSAGMGIRENLAIGRVSPDEIVSFVKSQFDASLDCIFLSCTNWQAIDAIEPLRSSFGIPIVTSNQAAIDAVRYLRTTVK